MHEFNLCMKKDDTFVDTSFMYTCCKPKTQSNLPVCVMEENLMFHLQSLRGFTSSAL